MGDKNGLSSAIKLLANGKTVPIHDVLVSVQGRLRSARNACTDNERSLLLDALSALLSRLNGFAPMNRKQYLDYIAQVQKNQEENPGDTSFDDAYLGFIDLTNEMKEDIKTYNKDIQNAIAAKEEGKEEGGNGKSKVNSTAVYKALVYTVQPAKTAIDIKPKQNLKELAIALMATPAELKDGSKGSFGDLIPIDINNVNQLIDVLAHFSGTPFAAFKPSAMIKELCHILNILFAGDAKGDSSKNAVAIYSLGNHSCANG